MNPEEVGEKWAAFVQSELPEGDYVSAVEASRIIDTADPQLLAAWLRQQAHSVVTVYIGNLRRADRNRLARVVARGAFADAVRDFEAGEENALDPFAVRYVISDDNTTRSLGDMTVDDLLYAADYYRGQAKAHLMQEAFLLALAKKVKKGKTVSECVNASQLASIQLRLGEVAQVAS